MKISLWGVRGSIPTFNSETKVYGGNTSCIEVVEDDWLLVLDTGSGIQNLNNSPSLKASRIDILLTHLHIDHIQGLGFFKPLFDADKQVHIWGPSTLSQSLRTRLGRFFSPPLFPVYFRNLTCQLYFHDIDISAFSIGPFNIRSQYIIHPGPTVGYRIQSPRGIFSFLPDHEPALGQGGILRDSNWLSGYELAYGADLLLHDAQYTREEYNAKMGWGHSCMEDTVQFAALTEAGRLLLMHHDPTHTDAQLDAMYAHLMQNNPYSIPIEMAVEGTTIEL